jgi:hypothetical protein
VGVTAPYDDRTAQQLADALGRPLNPDTGLPYPSASQAQLELAGELFARLIDGLDARELSREELRDALVEVAVRQHGRTIRACAEELRATADAFDLDARRHAQQALDSSATPGAELRDASRLAEAASTLRRVVFGGWRA